MKECNGLGLIQAYCQALDTMFQSLAGRNIIDLGALMNLSSQGDDYLGVTFINWQKKTPFTCYKNTFQQSLKFHCIIVAMPHIFQVDLEGGFDIVSDSSYESCVSRISFWHTIEIEFEYTL